VCVELGGRRGRREAGKCVQFTPTHEHTHRRSSHIHAVSEHSERGHHWPQLPKHTSFGQRTNSSRRPWDREIDPSSHHSHACPERRRARFRFYTLRRAHGKAHHDTRQSAPGGACFLQCQTESFTCAARCATVGHTTTAAHPPHNEGGRAHHGSSWTRESDSLTSSCETQEWLSHQSHVSLTSDSSFCPTPLPAHFALPTNGSQGSHACTPPCSPRRPAIC